MRKTKKQRPRALSMPTVGIDLGEASSHATMLSNDTSETFEFPMEPAGYSTLKPALAGFGG